MPIKFSSFPADISEHEIRLKFEKLNIPGFATPFVRSTAIDLVARVLSSSDVLVKAFNEHDGIVYSHWRYGRRGDNQRVLWHPVGGPYPELDNACIVSSIRAIDDDITGIVGVGFTIRRRNGS